MAVRFAADGRDFTRAITGPLTAISVACWAKISVDRDNYSTIWSIDSGSTSDVLCLQTDSTGTNLVVQFGGEQTLRTLTVGVWYFLGLIADNTNVTLISRAPSDTSFTVNTVAASNAATVAATTLRIGESPWGSEWLNGCVTGLRWWAATLTQNEMAAECFQHLPRRTNGLRGWYPLLTHTQTTDFSGAGLTLSGGAGASTEDGPPVSWRTGRHRIVLPSSGVTGNLAATLPALGASAAGTAKASGDVGGTLPALSTSIDSDLLAAGDLAGTLPALGAAADATADTPGELAATLPPLAAGMQADITPPNILAATLPALSAAVDATVMHGELAATLPAAVADVDAASTVEGAAAATLPALAADLHMDVIYDISPDAGNPATDWAASTPSRSWGSTGAARGWAAGRPTT